VAGCPSVRPFVCQKSEFYRNGWVDGSWHYRISQRKLGFCKSSNKCIAVRKVATPLRELTCHMGSHSVTCHPAEVTFPPLPQPKLVLDSATPEGCKAGYIPRWYTRPKTVTHPSTNRARRGLTSFMRRTPLTTTPRFPLELCLKLETSLLCGKSTVLSTYTLFTPPES